MIESIFRCYLECFSATDNNIWPTFHKSFIMFSVFANWWHWHLGLSVAYLSGRQSSETQQFGTYSQDDVDALRALADEPGIVDLFLTYPCSVMTYEWTPSTRPVATCICLLHLLVVAFVYFDFLNTFSLMSGQVGSQIELHLMFLQEYQIQQVGILLWLS